MWGAELPYKPKDIIDGATRSFQFSENIYLYICLVWVRAFDHFLDINPCAAPQPTTTIHSFTLALTAKTISSHVGKACAIYSFVMWGSYGAKGSQAVTRSMGFVAVR